MKQHCWAHLTRSRSPIIIILVSLSHSSRNIGRKIGKYLLKLEHGKLLPPCTFQRLIPAPGREISPYFPPPVTGPSGASDWLNYSAQDSLTQATRVGISSLSLVLVSSSLCFSSPYRAIFSPHINPCPDCPGNKYRGTDTQAGQDQGWGIVIRAGGRDRNVPAPRPGNSGLFHNHPSLQCLSVQSWPGSLFWLSREEVGCFYCLCLNGIPQWFICI